MSISDRLDEADATYWPGEDKAEGDKLSGVIVERYQRDGDWGPYDVLEIRDAAGDLFAWSAFGTVAKSRIEEKNPQPGDSIGIKYLGKKEPKSSKGKPYDDWKMVLEKSPQNVAAASSAAPAARAAAAPVDTFDEEPF